MGGLLGMTHRRAAEEPDRAPRRQRRRAGDRAGGARAHPRLLRHWTRRSRRYAEIEQYIRTISAPFGTLTDAQWDARDAHQCPAAPRRPLGTRLRSRASPSRSGLRPRRPTCGRCGTRSAVRRSCCAVRNRTCCRRRPRRRWPRAARSPRIVEFPDVGHAPMLLSPDQIEPVIALPASLSDRSAGRRCRTHRRAG